MKDSEKRKQTLLNLLQKDEIAQIIEPFVLLELGRDLPPITEGAILSATDEFDIRQKLYYKIEEKANKLFPANRYIFGKHIDQAINSFSPNLQAIYHTHLFECAIAIGDIEKVFHSNSELESKQVEARVDKLNEAYRFMNCLQMNAFIEQAQKAQSYEELQFLTLEYERIAKEVSVIRLKFIKYNWQEFVIN